MNTIKLRRLLLVGAVGFALVATAASGEEESSGSGNKDNTEESAGAAETDGEVSKGGGAKDASGDVSAPELINEGEGEFVLQYGQVNIKNNSSKRSDYFVTVVVEADGGATRVDETMVSVMGLEPGQSATEKGIFSEDIPEGATLRVTEVQRTASM